MTQERLESGISALCDKKAVRGVDTRIYLSKNTKKQNSELTIFSVGFMIGVGGKISAERHESSLIKLAEEMK